MVKKDIRELASSEHWDDRCQALTLIRNDITCRERKRDPCEDDWRESLLHNFVKDKSLNVRGLAAQLLGTTIGDLEDKDQAWNDIVQLACDKESRVYCRALESSQIVFKNTSNKKKAQSDIHALVVNKKRKTLRRAAARLLSEVYPHLPDKESAWDDYYLLLHDNDNTVRQIALENFTQVFPHLDDKEKAQSILHELKSDIKEPRNQVLALEATIALYTDMGDKARVEEHLLKSTKDQDDNVREYAIQELCNRIDQVSNRERVWKNLIQLLQQEDTLTGWRTKECIVKLFPHLDDKRTAQSDLIELMGSTHGADISVEVLSDIFTYLPDKDSAWEFIIDWIMDEERSLYPSTVSNNWFAPIVPLIPNKERVWSDLIRLIQHSDDGWRYLATCEIERLYPDHPNKKAAWDDIQKLTTHQEPDVQRRALRIIGNQLSHIPDRKQAQELLCQLSKTPDKTIRAAVADALREGLNYLPNGEQAIDDLIRLSKDEDGYVRGSAIGALGIITRESHGAGNYDIDLEQLIVDDDYHTRKAVFHILEERFQSAQDKSKMWSLLIQLTNATNNAMNREKNAEPMDWQANTNEKNLHHQLFELLESCIPNVPKKVEVQKDIHLFVLSKDDEQRRKAAKLIGTAFSDLPDKELAWDDLRKLAKDRDFRVKNAAVESIGLAFRDLPNKDDAWIYLLRFAKGSYSAQRSIAERWMPTAIQHLPNKEKAWDDLIKLSLSGYRQGRYIAASLLSDLYPLLLKKTHVCRDLKNLLNSEDPQVVSFAEELLERVDSE